MLSFVQFSMSDVQPAGLNGGGIVSATALFPPRPSKFRGQAGVFHGIRADILSLNISHADELSEISTFVGVYPVINFKYLPG